MQSGLFESFHQSLSYDSTTAEHPHGEVGGEVGHHHIGQSMYRDVEVVVYESDNLHFCRWIFNIRLMWIMHFIAGRPR